MFTQQQVKVCPVAEISLLKIFASGTLFTWAPIGPDDKEEILPAAEFILQRDYNVHRFFKCDISFNQATIIIQKTIHHVNHIRGQLPDTGNYSGDNLATRFKLHKHSSD